MDPTVDNDVEIFEPPRAPHMSRTERLSAFFGRQFSTYFEVDEYILDVPLKSIFLNIVHKMGASLPAIRYTTNDAEQIRMHIDLAVPPAYSFSNANYRCKVSSEFFDTTEKAEENAIKKCFAELANVHRVFVVDFSGRECEELLGLCDMDYRRSLGVFRTAEAALGDYGATLTKISRFNLVLRRKMLQHTLHGELTDNGKVYSDLLAVMEPLVKNSYTELSTMHDRFNGFDTARKDYLDYTAARSDDIRLNGLKKKIYFTEKETLAFLLDYISRPPAEYYNEVWEDKYMYIGYATIDLPVINNIDSAGKMKFRGKVKENSIRAEESAAAAAIRHIEMTYSVQIRDLNYISRMHDTKRKQELSGLKSEYQFICVTLKDKWSRLLGSLRNLAATYEVDSTELNEQVGHEAVQFCFDGVTNALKVAEEDFKAVDTALQEHGI